MANTRPKRPPSPTVLSLLAAIAPIPVHAAPPPPDFLLPTISPSPTIRRRALPPQRHVPDRYEKDEDGMWRRLPSYTLYGLTCSGACQRSTDPVSAVDDNIQVPGSSNSTSAPTPTPSIAFEDTLPPGWKPIQQPVEGRTGLILSLSLVLASLICFFIIGCLFWRTARKRRRCSPDIEARARRKRRHAAAPAPAPTSPTAGDKDPVEKELKTKQKLWARATARWKANVRYTARQRRGKRSISSRLSATSSVPSLSNPSRSHLPDDESPSISSSRASSRRSSTVSIPDLRSSHPPRPGSPAHSVSPPPSSHRAGTPSSPPAYQHRHQHAHNNHNNPTILISSPHSAHTSPLRSVSRRPSHSHQPDDQLFDSQDPADLFPSPSLHVATDDKTLLARLASLASSPLEDRDETSPGTSQPQVSAPVWNEDEELEAVLSVSEQQNSSIISPSTTNTTSSSAAVCPPSPQCPPSSSSPHPLFPPPPSKERILAMHKFYDYSFSYEEMTSLEPEPGPSAPPFEENTPSTPTGPSAPPLEDVGDDDDALCHEEQYRHDHPPLLLPSAPPLLEEDEQFGYFAEDHDGTLSGLEAISSTRATTTATTITTDTEATVGSRAISTRGDGNADVNNANGPKGQAHDREPMSGSVSGLERITRVDENKSSGSSDEDWDKEEMGNGSEAEDERTTPSNSLSPSTSTSMLTSRTVTTPPSTSHSGFSSLTAAHTLPALVEVSLLDRERSLARDAAVEDESRLNPSQTSLPHYRP